MAKYLWGSAAVLYALSVVSGLLLGYRDWWVAGTAILGLAAFGLWHYSSRGGGPRA